MTLLICKNLNFDMTSWINHTLKIHSAVSKVGLGFTGCCLKGCDQVFCLFNLTNSLSTTTCRCLKHDWIANFFCNCKRLFSRVNFTIRSWDNWNSSLDHLLTRIDLISHGIHYSARRADKLNPHFITHRGKLGVFAKKTKTWVDGFCFCQDCSRQNCIDIEIRLCRLTRSDTDSFIR